MAKQVQFRRGTSTEHGSFTGAVGEITFDTTLNTLRAHDGSTAGGTRLARYSEIVSSSRQVIAGTGLSGGGALSADVTLNLDTTQVVAPSRQVIAGTGLNGGGALSSDVTLNVDTTQFVAPSRQVIAGTGLSGGGALSSNVTLSVDSTVARLNAAQSYSAAQRGTIVTLIDGATITPNFSSGNNFALTIGGNRTLANPTNIAAGQSGVIVITNGGSHTLAFGSYWKFKDGTAPTITVSATDVLAYYCDSTTRISAAVLANVS